MDVASLSAMGYFNRFLVFLVLEYFSRRLNVGWGSVALVVCGRKMDELLSSNGA